MASSLVAVRETMRRSRLRAQHELAAKEHTIMAVTVAATLGLAEGKGHRLPSVFGIDGTIVVGTISLIVSDMIGGGASRFAQSVGDGLLAIGAYKMGRSVGGAAIGGVEDDVRAFEAHLTAAG